MLEIDILEGGRGTGKSTVAFKLRQLTPETTLINPTGFHMDGFEGLVKVTSYYKTWINLLRELSSHDSKIVFDRFFFSEQVFSQLYKEYDFKDTYTQLLDSLESLSELGVKVNIFFLIINNEKELQQRLMRDKVPFGKAEESVTQTLEQQNLYESLFNSIYYNRSSDMFRVYTIDTSGKTNEEVYEELLELKAT